MDSFNFITIRLGKDSTSDIERICASETGVLTECFTINVKCTQVPENYAKEDFAFLWLGSDNNKGVPTKWKQGFKAFGRVKSISKGKNYNDVSETVVEIAYIFSEAINRLDILRCAPVPYYWCSSMPLIGIDDHANQTIRNMCGSTFSDIRAFFSALNSVRANFRDDIIQIEPKFGSFFDITFPQPQNYPLAKNLEEILSDANTNKRSGSVFSYQPLCTKYIDIITAAKTKPFILLAGISGTGKSRIVRELARACWDEGSEEYKAQKPENFEMIQVKPNWHDSTELIGYVSRVSGEPVYVIGDFLRFVTKAWENLDVPYFLCLDEMNLAPVEQYFAEFLSVIESRKSDGKGHVTTDPILKKSTEDWYRVLTAELTGDNEALRTQFLEEGIALPQNLIVVGTVNMDETTFSFSRKVLDRAMTIEMNEVDLWGGLDYKYERIGKLSGDMLIGKAVEGVDVYADNKEVCDIALEYLKSVNEILDKTPFKVAYRTRNEFLLYVVNNLPYTIDEDGTEYSRENVIATALDEITSMKVLSRIEGDDTKVPSSLLAELKRVIREQLLKITGEDDQIESVSLAKLDEMQKRLKSGYTSFWS